MTADFTTAPLAPCRIEAAGGGAVEKSLTASHTEIQTSPLFGVLWLDNQNQLIEYDELFRGTLSQTCVYPREVVKQALTRNAAAAILVHNHPSSVAEQSRADELLTRSLKDALALVDVKVADHFIVAGKARPISFAERGLL